MDWRQTEQPQDDVYRSPDLNITKLTVLQFRREVMHISAVDFL